MVKANVSGKVAEPREPAHKVAFVLSGGANRGALQAGALLALLEQDIRPHILVGTSVGAINAAGMAINPTLEGAHWLAEVWRGVTKETVMPNGYLSMVWRLVTGKSGLFTNQNLRNFIESHLLEGIHRFADIKAAELYITAANLDTGELHVFGIDRSESILDAIMASTALPLLLPPWQYRGHRYVDGAVISDLPIRVATEMKAAEIYAIDVGLRQRMKGGLKGIFRLAKQEVDATAHQRVRDELDQATKWARGDIHYICVDGFEGLGLWDFSHTMEMIEAGRQAGLEHLRRAGTLPSSALTGACLPFIPAQAQPLSSGPAPGETAPLPVTSASGSPASALPS